ncbi:uncharacterized protein LOC117330661 [Pecten maximus]|uniref:uncharacterized protein LOC117330661 n=1 Tax=Pecten maximus TaxID=6579 RepID=UPI001458E0E7|nr:uncharacterized protein LOC117330661 [Pecten maximus]XP_033744986.1 uncharacterized protein LOC117330661 [Pecten maximus]XP_033744988.1 uncharacterized protein LOC117330661 [Pecten maximus]
MVYLPNLNTMVTAILWVVNLTLGYCPDDLLSEVFTCLHNLTYGSGDSMLITGADADRMQRHCRHGDLDDSVDCLNKIYSQCTSPRDFERLRKFADPDAWRSGFQRFCSNTDFYVERRTCVTKLDKELEKCIKRHEEFTIQSSKQIPSYSNDQVEERENQRIEQICRFFHGANQCLNSDIGSKCGPEISAILSDFAGGIMPPVCRGYTFDTSSASHIELSSLGLLLIFALLIFRKYIV